MKYNVVQAFRFEDLVDRVQQYVDAGWTLQGGLVVDTHRPALDHENQDPQTQYFQTIVWTGSDDACPWEVE